MHAGDVYIPVCMYHCMNARTHARTHVRMYITCMLDYIPQTRPHPEPQVCYTF